jgi:hypothetical protein
MGILQIDRVQYAVDSQALVYLPEALTSLFEIQPSIDIVLAFTDADIPVRVEINSPLFIETESGVDSSKDGAGLLLSEFRMMGHLRLNGVGAAPDPVY